MDLPAISFSQPLGNPLTSPDNEGYACRAQRLLGEVTLIRRWMEESFVVRVLQGSRTTILLWAAILIAVIALVDWHFENNISFGFLYLFPMLMVGGCLTRWQIAVVAAVCTGLTEAFDPFPWVMPVGVSRVILTFAAFFGMGFFGFA